MLKTIRRNDAVITYGDDFTLGWLFEKSIINPETNREEVIILLSQKRDQLNVNRLERLMRENGIIDDEVLR